MCIIDKNMRDEINLVNHKDANVNSIHILTSLNEIFQGLYPVLQAKLFAQLIHPELNETTVDTVKYYLHDDGLDDDLGGFFLIFRIPIKI